jgi:hypothetical protein
MSSCQVAFQKSLLDKLSKQLVRCTYTESEQGGRYIVISKFHYINNLNNIWAYTETYLQACVPHFVWACLAIIICKI